MIDTGQTTDVGIQREVNQDSAGVGELGDSLLLVVADGMGGHAAGEAAARLVVESMFERFEEGMGGDPRDNLYFGAQEAHRKVLFYAADHGTLGMGSTLVAAYIRDDNIWVAHVGDSRFYLFRDGKVSYRTTDHTRVQKLLEMGAISAAEAKKHPEGNIITRAVGHDRQDGEDRPFEADVLNEPLKLLAGDTLLLCSDGLYDLVDDREMMEIVAGEPAQRACDLLVAMANDRGGHDNITVVLLHAGGGTPPPGPEPEEPPTSSPATTLEDPIVAPAKAGGRGEAPDGPTRALYAGPEPDPPPPEPTSSPVKLLVVLVAALILIAVAVLLTRPSGTGSTASPANTGAGAVVPGGPATPVTDDDDSGSGAHASASSNDDDSGSDDDDSGSDADSAVSDDDSAVSDGDSAVSDDDDSGSDDDDSGSDDDDSGSDDDDSGSDDDDSAPAADRPTDASQTEPSPEQ